MDEQHNMQQPSEHQEPAHIQQEPVHEAPKQGGGMGPMIGVAIVILILIVGGLYFWGAQLNEEANELDDVAPLEIETSTGDSTDPSEIEEDLNDFDVDAFEAQLDADLDALEAELSDL